MKTLDERITILAILDGWQQGCWNAAKTGKPFAVEGIRPEHYRDLCEAICKACHYQYHIIRHRVNFDPLPQVDSHNGKQFNSTGKKRGC